MRVITLLLGVMVLVGCATNKVPSDAFVLLEPTDDAFDRDLQTVEAREIFAVTDLNIDAFNSEWQREWQSFELDTDAIDVEQADFLGDALYDFPIDRIPGDSEIGQQKDSLAARFGSKIRITYVAPKSEFASEEDAKAAYVEAAKVFYASIEELNELTVTSSDPRKIPGTDLPQSVIVFQNYLSMKSYDKGEAIVMTEDETNWYGSGLIFDPTLTLGGSMLARANRTFDRQVDAVVTGFVAIDEPNLYLTIGQNSTIYLPPGVVDNDGMFHIAYSYRDGESLTLPVELFLYATRDTVYQLRK